MTQVTIEQAMQIALGHHQAGRLAEAEGIYRQVLARCPGQADALHLLGTLACQAGRLDAAIDLIGRAIAVNPGVAEYHSNLGETYRRSGQLEKAIVQLRQATEIKADLADAHNSLGLALTAAGRPAEAIIACGRAIEIQPGYAEAHNNLGNALSAMGRRDEAIAAYRKAVALRPDHDDAQNNLGVAMYEAGRLDDAITAYNRAITLRPDRAEPLGNLGVALHRKGRRDEAVAALGRALELEPGHVEAMISLGNIFKDEGRLNEALDLYRRALMMKPCFALGASNLLQTLHYHPDYDARGILAEHRQWARQCAEPLAVRIPPHRNHRDPDRRLRIGFVSPDFRSHPVGYSLVPLFSHLDRRQTEIVCYSDVRGADDVTMQLKTLVDQWCDIAGQSDAGLAERIRADRVDILVDLALHTARNRMLVFARKPAPVQVTMIGMPTTTGLVTIDYRLTDPYLDPPDASDDAYTEQSIRLPHCFLCYQPAEGAPPVSTLPARKAGGVTFGCLNQFAKVTRPTLQVWVKILHSFPASRLVIHSQPGAQMMAVCDLFSDGGVAPARLDFVAKAPRLSYLQRYHELDICLDPFPFNGNITTLDALWMGVPVVTLVGRTAVGRAGVSILSNVGLPELIAGTPDEYAAIALDWARDPARLATLREGLRRRMLASPLMDGKRWAADVATAFRQFWKIWCARSGAV